ncbi:class I SAM-dependent methyltransferase [Nonomuraea sp. KC401]|uniref:class I SAM-dependent methyltransferase n=1 Tax=unclassified Nonomuraea TaxID=2593643 RepID=UPI0010FEE11D|nr:MULTISPECIES: class I SAM-dependent methyltransferase [unclassified Nonomuraea]NBE97260.1 class I SAM-dependent methyltransferase [Nonomuraea sp. K271]TLF65860.1 class I SAM-dependent methyltransferase [Nonomuraea sp. KC401]
MDKILIDFTGVRATALLELYLRWLDSRDRRPILRDPWPQQAIQRLDFDFSQFKSTAIGRFPVAVRSRVMDGWVAKYLANNPDALVLDLGCGLDFRVSRVGPPPGHHWYDVDFPDVIEVARQLYPERAEHTTIGASVVDPGWLAQIPGDRPVVVVADGLFGFLSEEEARQVFRQIMDHFPRGEFIFNNISSSIKNRHEKRPSALFKKFSIEEKWALDDARGAEKLDDRLLFVDEENQLDTPLLARTPFYYRTLCALISMVPSWRESGWILRYQF